MQNKWIDPKKKMPPKNSTFLVYDKQMNEYCLGDSTDGVYCAIDNTADSYGLDDDWVWMKFPKPPKDTE